MDVLAPAGPAINAIPADHYAAAARYIAAIVEREGAARLGQAYAELRARQLWDELATHLANLAFGPYARGGDAGLRIALGRL